MFQADVTELVPCSRRCIICTLNVVFALKQLFVNVPELAKECMRGSYMTNGKWVARMLEAVTMLKDTVFFRNKPSDEIIVVLPRGGTHSTGTDYVELFQA